VFEDISQPASEDAAPPSSRLRSAVEANENQRQDRTDKDEESEGSVEVDSPINKHRSGRQRKGRRDWSSAEIEA
jgi:hypothetical protein